MSEPTATPAPKRRWFRFSLRTLFVVVTVAGGASSWSLYQRDWIRQRHELMSEVNGSDRFARSKFITWTPARAPGMLWLFGEQGRGEIERMVFSDAPAPETEIQRDLEEARRLFPEAKVVRSLIR